MNIFRAMWIVVIVFVFGMQLVVTIGNYQTVKSLLVTRRINNIRISKLQLERKQMQKVLKRLAKGRFF